MSSVQHRWKGWLSVDDYLASGPHDRPVFLVLDTLASKGDDSIGLREVLESPAIRHVLQTSYVRIYDYTELHPELCSIVVLAARAGKVEEEQPSVFVLTPDLFPVAAIATRTRSRRLLPASRLHAQIRAIRPGSATGQPVREDMLEQHKRKQISACLSATVSNTSHARHWKSLDDRPLDECLKSATYNIGRNVIEFLDPESPGIVYPYTDHVNRWSDLGILILLARSFVLREQEGQRLLAMNIDKMLTCHMHDVMYGGLFTKTDFAWCNPFPAKVLLTQFRCIELLIDSLRRYQARPYKHIVQWTLGCCLRDFLHPEAGLFVPSRSYMSSGGSLIHWTIGDFSECLSADDLQFLEDTLDLETVRRSQDKGCPVRLKRLDLGDSEFERLQRLVQEVGTRKRRDIDLPPAQPPLMYDNAHAARILLDAGVYLGNHELEILGLEILDCLWTAFDGDTGKLASTFHDGCWQGAATLIDYAFLTQALLAGYTHTLRPAYLERAEAVHQATLSRFWHEEHGTFRVFSRTYTKQLDALRGTDFLGGVGVAFKNHVLFSRYRGEDPAAFIRNVFNIFCNGLVHGADEEYTEIVDFLNGCALMTPVRVMCSRSDSEMWRELVLQVHQLPPYCRRNIIMLDAHHKQAEVFRQQGPADGEVAPDAIWVWPDSKPAAILQSRENIKAYFDGLQRDFAADVAAISDMDGLEHLRPRKEARESAPGVES